MRDRVIIEPFARLLYAVIASLFWYGVAKEYEWTDGAFTASVLLSIVVIYLIPLDTGEEKKPPLKGYQSGWMLITPGTNVLIDLTGIPEGHRDMLQVNLSEDGIAVQVAITGPHPTEPILEVDGGWGTHWAMTRVRRYAAEAHRTTDGDENNVQGPASTSSSLTADREKP